MKNIQVGDIFEIATPKGNGYFQYVYRDKTDIELIRILPGLYLDQPQEMSQLAATKELYFIGFPLKAAHRRKIVKLIGTYKLPEGFELPKAFRAQHIVRGNFICWHIVDYDTWKRDSVKELTEEQRNLSPWGTWNDTLLIERMATGWTLESWL
jgi:hypothetical protein